MHNSNHLAHSNSLVLGTCGILIRGSSGSGKTSLMLRLIETAKLQSRFAAMISDDQTALSATNGRLIARQVDNISSLVEIRGLGILSMCSLRSAIVHLVVDLVDASIVERMPSSDRVSIEGISIRHLRIPSKVEDKASRMIFHVIGSDDFSCTLK